MAKKTFEQSLKQLEEIVAELEAGDLPLEKAMKKFEDGIQLSKMCSDMLDATEKKIALLVKGPDGNLLEKPFAPDSEENTDPEDS